MRSTTNCAAAALVKSDTNVSRQRRFHALERGAPADHAAALRLLDDPDRIFLTSPFVELEVLPHAVRERKHQIVRSVRRYFEAAESSDDLSAMADLAYEVLLDQPLGLADALHVAAAHLLNADEFVTTEKPKRNNPLFRTRYVRVVEL